MLKAAAFIKKGLPPSIKRLLRRFATSTRGLATTSLTHAEIATLLAKSNPTILEIGCNDGGDTLAFLRLMPQAKLYCFEPDPRAIRRFKTNLGPRLCVEWHE